MEALRVGYNLIEIDKIGNKYEDIDETISIINFLRLLNQNATIPKKIKVLGLERFLSIGDRELSKFVRNLLSQNASRLIQKNHIVLFPVSHISLDTEPRLGRVEEKPIRLVPIFGNRLEQIDIGYFYAPFNI